MVMYGLDDSGYCTNKDYIIYFANPLHLIRRDEAFKHMLLDDAIESGQLEFRIEDIKDYIKFPAKLKK